MSATNYYTAVPAWWDPKDRKVIFNEETIVCGIILVDRAGVVFVSPTGVEFELPAAGLGVSWTKMGMAGRLQTPTASYLIYLAPPTDGSPRLNRSAVRGIAETLTTTRDLADLADLAGDIGSLADVLGVAGILGDTIKAVSAVSGLIQARRSRQTLTYHFTQFACAEG
jgi:hypothetical protein